MLYIMSPVSADLKTIWFDLQETRLENSFYRNNLKF